MNTSEIKKIIGAGVSIITDTEYAPVSRTELLFMAQKYYTHRTLYELIGKELRGAPTKESLCEIVNKNFGSAKPFQFVKDRSDCDDAVRKFIAYFSGLGLAIGEAIIEGHDLVVAVTPDEEKFFIEAETCQLSSIDRNTHIKVLRM